MTLRDRDGLASAIQGLEQAAVREAMAGGLEAVKLARKWLHEARSVLRNLVERLAKRGIRKEKETKA